MKIVSQTPELLILENQPWLIAVILGGMSLGFVALGVGVMASGDVVAGLVVILIVGAFFGLFLWAFVRRNQLILDRTAGTLTHRRRTLRGYRETVHELAHLQEAVIQSSSGSGSNTHRMAYVLGGGMDVGTHPFTEVYTSGRGAQTAVQAVNGWLAAAPSSSGGARSLDSDAIAP
ncbi:hypothetical protein [Thalassorhabdomicrobium marinisediminis]|uniref:hypothetical protein n=1 Tax=Thalassorhabdomicrobium marinisediminis TaxID=2170577 RepID=UPI002492B999|nr:hypothetical protein [Thalassorhabdomicrobium marinisediminis]